MYGWYSRDCEKCFPAVHVINGDGNLYWSGGMRKAWDVAAKTHDYDYYLWFNDDAVLYENALEMMFEPFEKYGEKLLLAGHFVTMMAILVMGAEIEITNM